MLNLKTNNDFNNRIFTSFMFIRARSFTSIKKKTSPLHSLFFLLFQAFYPSSRQLLVYKGSLNYNEETSSTWCQRGTTTIGCHFPTPFSHIWFGNVVETLFITSHLEYKHVFYAVLNPLVLMEVCGYHWMLLY